MPARNAAAKASATISVVITNYNYERYIKAAIDSVLRQTRPADEIVVIDDGSTDGSGAIIRSYGDLIRPVFQQNSGMQAVFNHGFAESSGDIVMFLDADDVLYPDTLEAVAKVFRPGVAKIQFDLDIIDQNGELAGRRYCAFPAEMKEADTAEEFARTGTYPWPVTSGNVYARVFLEKVMPMTPPVGFDGVFNTIAPLYGSIVTISSAKAQYRVHDRNISRISDAGGINTIPDFASRIRFRKQEFDILREHAARLGRPVPAGDLLDNELVFVNYRLMARKVGREDGADRERSIFDLWRTAMLLVVHGRMSWRARLKHAVWLTALAIAPGSLARGLIHVRFNRTRWRSRLRGWIPRTSSLAAGDASRAN